MKEMIIIKITFLPKTRLGKWSVIFTILSFFLLTVGSVFPIEVKSYSGLELIIQNPVQTIITMLLFVIGVATSIMGLISAVKNKERSILVFLAIPSGLFNTLSIFVSIIYVLNQLNP